MLFRVRHLNGCWGGLRPYSGYEKTSRNNSRGGGYMKKLPVILVLIFILCLIPAAALADGGSPITEDLFSLALMIVIFTVTAVFFKWIISAIFSKKRWLLYS
jgi:hypothetical protein